MADPVVHFEIIGKNASRLRIYYEDLFGWKANTDSAVAPEVSAPGNYGFIDKVSTEDGTGIPGGIGGGEEYDSHTVFYVGVENVKAALKRAESLGGKIVMGPVEKPGGGLVVGHFKDPEGNLIGLAGPR
jgi:predicted enzyme related to lactoylglutathione lyase